MGIFTVLLMRVVLGIRFSGMQGIALGLLVGGGIATQIAESSKLSTLTHGGNPLLGGALTIVSALFAAIPNVFYERILKKSDAQTSWAATIQLTVWIFGWIALT